MAWKKQEWIVVDEVTIKQSSIRDSSRCMIADAIKKAMPHLTGVSVDMQSIRFTDKVAGKRYCYFTPMGCQTQLLRFDDGEIVEPWAFKLPGRPAQIVPVKADNSPGRKNEAKRPTTQGKKTMVGGTRREAPVVMGGKIPPLGLLGYAPAAGRHPGTDRKFGAKVAGRADGVWRERRDEPLA